MAEKNLVIAELRNRGYHVEEQKIVKNGVGTDSLIIGTGTVRPIIPAYFVDRHEDVDEAVCEIIVLVKQAQKDMPRFESINFFDTEYLKKNLRIGVQRKGNMPLVKRDTEFEGIEQYLYIQIEIDKKDMTSINLKEEHLQLIDADIDELWEIALENTKAEACKPMSVLQKMFQIGCIDDDIDDADDFPMRVITNKQNARGASQILNTELLKSVADKFGAKGVYILPSSIHECLVVPENQAPDLETLTDMVTEVNATQVDPIDQLSDIAYYKAF